MNNKILVLDLETTGFKPPQAQIVEVGIVELDLSTGEKKTLFDEVILPFGLTLGQIENAWIVKNGYMTVDEIMYGKPIEFYRFQIQEILSKYPNGVTAFNNKFDFLFMDYEGFVYTKLDCPMLLSTPICNIPGRYGKAKWPSVQEAYDHFFPGNDYDEKHRGADDAFHEADIVKKLYDLGVFIV